MNITLDTELLHGLFTKYTKDEAFSKLLPFIIVDALYLKVREDGRIKSKGLLIATGVNESGHREVLGFEIVYTESESS